MILITGATGNIGSEIVKQLTYDGVPVRALVRNRAKAEAIAGPGVEIVEGDLAKPESLDAAMKGVERVLLLSSPDPHQVTLQRNVIQAAKKAGVKHIVKISAMGAAVDSPLVLGRWHGETEAEIERSGLAWTHIQPNAFMQNMLMSMPSIASEGAIYAPMSDAKISFVDVRDIAEVAEHCLTESGHEGKHYVVTGPEALSYHEVASKLSAAIGKPVRYVNVSPADAKAGMKKAGMPDWLIDGLLELYDVWSQGHGADTTPVVSDVARKQPITFDEFARDYAPLFKQGMAGAAK